MKRYYYGVTGIIRIVGLVVAAVWFGGTVFFTFFAGPSMFSTPMLELFGAPAPTAKFWAGSVAQIQLQTYFFFHYTIGGLAVGLMVFEWFAFGKAFSKYAWGLGGGAFLVILVGGLLVQPRLRSLHATMYAQVRQVTQKEADQARDSFRRWHAVSQLLNLAVLASLGGFAYCLYRPPVETRFFSHTKYSVD